MARPALRTRPLPILEGQRIVLRSADRTQAAARIPAVGNHQPDPIALRFVFHLRAKHPKAHVTDGARQPPIRQHPLHVHVLDGYRLVFAAQPGGELVGEIAPDVGHAGVGSGQSYGRLFEPLRFRQARPLGQGGLGGDAGGDPGCFQLAAESPPANLQSAQGRLEQLRRSDSFAAGQCRGGRDANIHPAHAVSASLAVILRISHLDMDRHKPAVSCPGDRRAQDVSVKAQGFRHGDRADFGEMNGRAVQAKLVVGDVEAVSAMTLLLELWRMGGSPGFTRCKEPDPRPAQVREGLRVRVPVNRFDPRILGVLDGVELLLERHRVWLKPCGILSVPLGQRPVPDEPRRATSTTKVVGLLRRWAKSDFVRQVHDVHPVSGRHSTFFDRFSIHNVWTNNNAQCSHG